MRCQLPTFTRLVIPHLLCCLGLPCCGRSILRPEPLVFLCWFMRYCSWLWSYQQCSEKVRQIKPASTNCFLALRCSCCQIHWSHGISSLLPRSIRVYLSWLPMFWLNGTLPMDYLSIIIKHESFKGIRAQEVLTNLFEHLPISLRNHYFWGLFQNHG